MSAQILKSSNRVSGFKPAAVHEMLARGRELEQQGSDVVFMVQGEPDFTTPSVINEAIFSYSEGGSTHYTPAAGLADLRGYVADYLGKKNNLPVSDSSEVIVTTGATQGLFIALMGLIDQGDEVLLIEPGFVATYSKMIKMAGGEARRIACPFDGERFPLDIDAIKDAISDSTKAIIINTPSNPTGTVYTQAELEALADLALSKGIIVISDEAYESLVFDDSEHISIGSLSREMFENTVSIFTFSKTYAMTGWRIGYSAASPEIVRWMTAVQTVSARCAAAPVQKAVLDALKGGAAESEVVMIEAYKDRRSIVIEELAKNAEIAVPKIEGTFYTFPDFSSRVDDSYKFARQLLEEELVVSTPGAYYGEHGESHLRLSFSYEKERIVEGLQRLMKFYSRYE